MNIEDCDERKELLMKALDARGLELRADSILCQKYINGQIELDLDWIVQRMCEMKYLYEYCNMNDIKKQVYKQYVLEQPNGIYTNYKISERAEKIALEKYGFYPDVFPWEKKSQICVKTIQICFGMYLIALIAIPVLNDFYSKA